MTRIETEAWECRNMLGPSIRTFRAHSEQAMMGFGTGLGFGLGGLFWTIGIVLVLVGAVVLVAWVVSPVNSADGRPGAPVERNEAVEVLRVRFARGEITEAEYTQALNVLRSDR